MTDLTHLPAEILTTGENPEFCIIWLHGLGADGNDFIPLVPELGLPDQPTIKFVFPHAPVRPITINNGYRMRAWFDIQALSGDQAAKETDILASVELVNRLIEQQIREGFPSNRILLAGFSQGGVIALHAGLRFPKRLAGIIALSTYLPFAGQLFAQSNAVQLGLPIFAAHGTQDPVLPYQGWQQYVPLLKVQGYAVEARSYEMPHSLCADEVQDLSNWLKKVLADSRN